MIAGGIGRVVLLEDLIDIALVMEATGRHVPRVRWVTELRDLAEDAALDALI